MKRFTRAITRWGWLPPVLAAAAIVVAGTVGVAALTGNGGSAPVEKAALKAAQAASGGGSTTTTTVVPPPDAKELCQTIADEGYTLEGNQVLATLDGAGTQVRASDAKAAAEAYLSALSADVMLVGDAELVYQAVGIHPSRILGATSEDVDPNHELELIQADSDHRDEVCQQTVLEAQESLETGELSHVTLTEQASFNILVHDEANEMLPTWVCQVPMPEEGIDVLGFAQFVDLETGEAPQQVLWSLTQRAYVSFGACPDGGVAADGDFEAVLVECEEGQEIVDRVCVDVAVTPSTAPEGAPAATTPTPTGVPVAEPTPTSAPGGDGTPVGPSVPNPTGPPNGPAGPGCGVPGQPPCPGGGETSTTVGGTTPTSTVPSGSSTTTVPGSSSTTTIPSGTTTTTVASTTTTTTTTVPRTTTTTTVAPTTTTTTTTVPRTTTTTTVAPTTTTTTTTVPDLCPNIPGTQGPGWSGWDEGWRIDPDGNCKAPDPGGGGL